MKPVGSFMTFLRSHLTKDQRRFVKFVVVGASGVPVNLGIVYLITAWTDIGWAPGARDTAAYLAGIVVSIFTNFLLNNAWTWGDRAAEDPGGFWRRLSRFYLVSATAAVVQFVTSVYLSSLMRGSEAFSIVLHGEYRLYHLLAPLAGVILGLAINYVANNVWTFRRRNDQEHPEDDS
ncbi:MAG: GtrA family protein [Deltaproteobacteria bacterium]|nr:GtrA family protein [Deltaproteobacteria bacterium]